MFTVSDAVENTATAPVRCPPTGRLAPRQAAWAGYYVLHEGLIGVIGDEGQCHRQIFRDEIGQADAARVDRPAGSASPTNTGRRRWFPTGGSRSSRASRPLRPDRRRPTRPTSSANPSRSRPADRRDRDAALRRRQGSGDDRRLRERSGASASFDLLIDWGWFFFITKPMF